jgi:predicted dehydrogenase
MSLSPDVTRRSFLKTTAAAGIGALSVPAADVLGANETLNVGLIGTGGRCRHLMKSLAVIPNVRMAAVCDVYDVHLEEAKKLADPKAFATKQYRDVLDRKDIDAVLIAAPDHWHVLMTVDACAAGKDV